MTASGYEFVVHYRPDADGLVRRPENVGIIESYEKAKAWVDDIDDAAIAYIVINTVAASGRRQQVWRSGDLPPTQSERRRRVSALAASAC